MAIDTNFVAHVDRDDQSRLAATDHELHAGDPHVPDVDRGRRGEAVPADEHLRGVRRGDVPHLGRARVRLGDIGGAQPRGGEDARRDLAGRQLDDRMGTPEEIAGPIVFLCTPWAGFISGEVFNVNGGAVLVG